MKIMQRTRFFPHSRSLHQLPSLHLRLIGLFAGVVLGLIISLAAPFAHAQGVVQRDLPRATLNAGMYLIQVQIAATADQRATGLMFRKSMPPNEGMLFIFDRPQMQCFWMQNTLLPLTAAFLADDGTIVNTADMQPKTTNSHCSNRPVRYVLEVHQGWLAQHGFGPGHRLSGGPFGQN